MGEKWIVNVENLITVTTGKDSLSIFVPEKKQNFCAIETIEILLTDCFLKMSSKYVRFN